MRSFLIFSFLTILVAGCASASPAARAAYQRGAELLASSSLTEEQMQEAVSLLTQAMDGGSADAALALGYLSLRGNGMVKDATRAVELFQEAGRLGSRDGQYNAGLAFIRGDGVAVDYDRAAYWFTKAALQGDAGAQYNLGVMAMNGEGMPRDLPMATVWFTLAEEQAYKGAAAGRAAAMNAMSSEEARSVESLLQRTRKSIQPTSELSPLSSSAPSL